MVMLRYILRTLFTQEGFVDFSETELWSEPFFILQRVLGSE